jgi:hypothetical protein
MISKQDQKSVLVMLTGLNGFEDRLYHAVHLLLLRDHVWWSGPTHVFDVVDSEIMEDHRIPVALLHFFRDVASDVAVDFGVVLRDDESTRQSYTGKSLSLLAYRSHKTIHTLRASEKATIRSCRPEQTQPSILAIEHQFPTTCMQPT